MLVAARRSGKTTVSILLAILAALEKPHSLVGYVAPTLTQAVQIFWVPLMRQLSHPLARKLVRSMNQSTHSVVFRNGSEIRLYSAETRPVERIRGNGFDMLITDECDDANFSPLVYDEIIWPALADRQGFLVQIGTPKGRGRLYHEFLKGKEPGTGYASLQVTAIEAGVLDLAEIERFRRTLPRRSFRQELEASFESPTGLVYDEYDDQLHVVSREQWPLRFDEIIVGVDWGTAHYGAMVVVGLDKVTLPATASSPALVVGRAWVLEEHAHSGMGYDDGGWWAIARGIQQRWQPECWYADPAGGLEGYIRQLTNALDGSRANVYPANNQVAPGIAMVRQFLHFDRTNGDPPRLLILESCERLRGEMQSYRFKPHPTVSDAFTDSVVKENDDVVDALRYALNSHFEQTLH